MTTVQLIIDHTQRADTS